MEAPLSPYDALLLAAKNARIANQVKILQPLKILARRTIMIDALLERIAYVEDFSQIRTEDQTLDLLLKQVAALTFGPPRSTKPQRLPISAVHIAIEDIYRDLDNLHRNMAMRDQEIKIIWKGYFGKLQHQPAWYQTALTQVGNILFPYLIRCKSFIYSAIDMTPEMFNTFLAVIKQETTSMMIFARVRLPKIKSEHTGLAETFSTFDGLSRKKDHHWYIVPGLGVHQAITPTFVGTIENNFFDPNGFCYPCPSRPLFVHPGVRFVGTKCCMCKSRNLCHCEPPSALKGDLLLEIYHHRKTGLGIRALQRVPSRTILGEFVGCLRSITDDIDPAYSMEFCNSPPSEPLRRDPIAIIDAGNDGNWTRFIRFTTDKEANVRFIYDDIGQYRRLIVRAIRDICLYDELTMNPDTNMTADTETPSGKVFHVPAKIRELLVSKVHTVQGQHLAIEALKINASPKTLNKLHDLEHEFKNVSLKSKAVPAVTVAKSPFTFGLIQPSKPVAQPKATPTEALQKSWLSRIPFHSEHEKAIPLRPAPPRSSRQMQTRSQAAKSQSQLEQSDSDSDADADDEAALAPGPVKNTRSRLHANNADNAAQRRARKHAARRDADYWRNRWIGRDDPENPRRDPNHEDEFFGEF